MQSGKNIYDAYINDSDLIGTHFRYQQVVPLYRLDERRRQGRHRADARCRRLHRQSFTTGPDGKLYQLPDQQFANLYWFRYDWFKRPDLKAEIQGNLRL